MAMREPATIEQRSVVSSEPIFRLSLEQYHELARIGILTDDDPVELLEGLLVAKARKSPPHSYVTHTLRSALQRSIPDGWHTCTHDPITTRDSEPEPDVIVVRGQRSDYHGRHPGPDDVALV